MKLYLFFFFICFALFTYSSIKTMIFDKKNYRIYLFYYLVVYVLLLTSPIYIFYFKSITLGILEVLISLFLSTILAYRLVKKDGINLYYTIWHLFLLYFTFCYLLAINLSIR